jgi:transcriptional regulator with XRE-family HTH domain
MPLGRGRPSIGDGEIWIIRRLRYEFGYSGAHVAELVGRSVGTVLQYAPGRPGKIDNDKLREAFLESGVSAPDLARRLGWGYDKDDSYWAPDSSRVKRWLGINPDINGEGIRTVREQIDAAIAVEMCEALGIPPEDVGAR